MFLTRVGERGDDLARAALQLGTLGLVAGVAMVSVLAGFKPSGELGALRSRLELGEPELGSKVFVLVAGYLLASLLS